MTLSICCSSLRSVPPPFSVLYITDQCFSLYTPEMVSAHRDRQVRRRKGLKSTFSISSCLPFPGCLQGFCPASAAAGLIQSERVGRVHQRFWDENPKPPRRSERKFMWRAGCCVQRGPCWATRPGEGSRSVLIDLIIPVTVSAPALGADLEGAERQ